MFGQRIQQKVMEFDANVIHFNIPWLMLSHKLWWQ
ncbi:hypothetical protein BV329_05684 [Pseudomonas syringae pv. actinidiae]|nr:hypothetical protein BV329_05684 [Pseudomonas syringae pv. actinidiae]